MKDIVAVGDVHEGINFGYRPDPLTGVTARAMDIHRNFTYAAKYAIDHDSNLFVILGDLFDRPNVSPVFREIVRRDVIEPLGRKGVEIWILAGNHDQPRSMARSTSLDDFRGYDHVRVFRTPEVVTRKIGGKDIGFIVAPFLHPEQIVARIREETGREFAREDWFHAARVAWKEWLGKSAKELDSEVKILLGHYYVEGAQLSAFNRIQYLPSEFSFTKDMIPEEVDLSVFAHIHLHQAVTEKIVYAGSVERIDWGEREEDKGFLSIDVESKGWEFVKLETRPMLRLQLDLTESDAPTEDISSRLPEELEGKMLRLHIKGPEGFRARVDEKRLENAIRDAFHYELRWEEVRVDKGGFVEFTVDPRDLFQRFVDLNYGKHKAHEKILEYGRNVLNGVLE